MTYDEAVAQLEDLAAIIGRSSDGIAIRVVLDGAKRRDVMIDKIRDFVPATIGAAESDIASEVLARNAVKEAWAKGERTAASLILSFIDAVVRHD
ncbi:MAG: hypothetical protein IT577_23860 [Verrucomicrobiae bacterium]|nr:hypothetical protein [Verrucomicrobiae bacterium]